MSLDLSYLLESFGVGFATGLFSGGFGVGGGIVCTPLLRMFLGVEGHVAIGTTMALIIPTSVSGSLNYLRSGLIDKRIAVPMVLPAVLGVLVGARLTVLFAGKQMMVAFAGLVLFSALDLSFGIVQRLFARDRKVEPPDTERKDADFETAPAQAPADGAPDRSAHPSKCKAAAVGLVAGLLAGFFGIGGGFIMIPCMLYLFKTPIKEAFGTSLLVVAAVSIPGTITHAFLGHVNFPLMLSMMVGSVPGSLVGSSASMKLKDTSLKKVFGAVMLIVACLLAWRELT